METEMAGRKNEPETGHDGASIQPWDQAEADRLLLGLRTELAAVERGHYRGRMPPAAANLAADGLAIADGYIANHEAEEAKGWDAMELLREMAQELPGIVRGDRQKAS